MLIVGSIIFLNARLDFPGIESESKMVTMRFYARALCYEYVFDRIIFFVLFRGFLIARNK